MLHSSKERVLGAIEAVSPASLMRHREPRARQSLMLIKYLHRRLVNGGVSFVDSVDLALEIILQDWIAFDCL